MSAGTAPVGGEHRTVRRRPFVVRNARVLLAYAILVVLLFVYQEQAPRFTEREWL